MRRLPKGVDPNSLPDLAHYEGRGIEYRDEAIYWAGCLLALAFFAAFVVVLNFQGQPTNLSDDLLGLAAALVFGVLIWLAARVIIYVLTGRTIRSLPAPPRLAWPRAMARRLRRWQGPS